MQHLKKTFPVKFYLVEILVGAGMGLLVNSHLTSTNAHMLQNNIYLSCAGAASVGLFLYQSNVEWIEVVGSVFTKIALNLLGVLVIVSS